MLRSLGLLQRLPRSTTFTSPTNFVPRHSVVRQASTVYSHGSSTSRESSKWPRRARSLLCAVVFAGIGYRLHSVEWMSRNFKPGSPEEIMIMEQTLARYESLPLVVKLKADPDFEELGVNDEDNISEETKARSLTTGAMGGYRGFAIKRTFWNEKQGLAMSIVFFGPGLCGWPPYVHGGAISVAVDEELERIALRLFPDTRVTTNLNINYRALVKSSEFYIVSAQYDHEKSSERKAFIDGIIIDLKGDMCVGATKALNLYELEDVNSARDPERQT